MIDKFVSSVAAALAGIADGAVIMLGGFGAVGQPQALIEGLLPLNLKNLTIVANNAGAGFGALPQLMEAGAIAKVICSYPRGAESSVFMDLYLEGKIALELVPQGNLAERIRAAAVGIPAFFTPTGAGTLLGAGKETRTINGRLCILETALFADVALLEAWEADRWGNLTYRLAGRNFNPVMAGAAKLTVVEAHHVAELGTLEPDTIMTPGIYVDRIVHVPYSAPPV